MVDTVDSKSTAERRPGSSPGWGTKDYMHRWRSGPTHSSAKRKNREFKSHPVFQISTVGLVPGMARNPKRRFDSVRLVKVGSIPTQWDFLMRG